MVRALELNWLVPEDKWAGPWGYIGWALGLNGLDPGAKWDGTWA